MEFLTAIIPVILEPLVSPIKRHFSYALRYRGKVNALSDEVKALQVEIDIVRSRIGRGEEAETYVLDWQTRTERAIALAETVVRSGEGEAQRGCCSLRLKTRYRIGKLAADGKAGIVQLREERGRFGPIISRLPDLQQIVPPPVEDYSAESRIELLDKVMAELLDPHVAMVGVHGMGGIGKTTLAKEVHRQATQKKLFDKVVLATVTATPELRKIQDEIAEFIIGSKLQESSDSARASRLNQMLKDSSKDTRILIILDDLWHLFELGKVGIPTGYDGRGCKILLSSRRVDLLSDMGSKKNFPVGLLSKNESMRLFEKEVVEVRDSKIAEKILDKCGGFPLLIVTVAGLVRNKGLHSWKDVLVQLSKFDNQEIHGKVYSTLNLSYDRLACEETKSIFLLCGICSRADTTLLDLLRYSLGLNLLKHYSVSDARNRLETLIDNLKACSLLDVDQMGIVKMHDVVRDMCVAHKDQRAFRHKESNALKEWPDEGDINNCTRVSLPYSDIRRLPEDLGCPDVEFLLVFSNWRSINIPDSTFQRTGQLKVVHFSRMEFATLPKSLQSLTNLHTLCLEQCHLLDVASIGQLKNLEILSLRESDLDAMPIEMGHLTRLKLLDLSGCFKLDFIPANVISKMTSLEELLMINSFDNWEIEECTDGRKARLSELKYLSRLASLEISIPKVQALPKEIFFNGLERYEIRIGHGRHYLDRPKTTKTLKLKLYTDSTDLLQQFRGLLKDSETLILYGINGSTNILYDLDNQGFPKLKELFVGDSSELQQIVDCRKRGAATVCFPLLEHLKLDGLTSIVTICDGRPAPESFGKIKRLEISGCSRLKNLMSLSLVRSLSQLENIVVTQCNQMEALFVEESDSGFEGDEVVDLPFRRLILEYLPQLKCFLHTGESPFGSDNMMSFFHEKVALPNLEGLKLKSIGNIKMIWCNKLPLSSFGKLNSLDIDGCHELQTVFPYYAVKQFQNLKSLTVRNCSLLEKTYQFGDAVVGNSYNNDPMIFGLSTLNLYYLPRLKSICSDEQHLSFRKLKSVEISRCESLKNLFPLVVAESLSELKSLDVTCCDRLEEIVAGGEISRNFSSPLFPQLASLTLKQLPFFSLEKVFPNLEMMSTDGRIWKSVLESSESWLTYLTRLKSLELSSWKGKGTLKEAFQFGSIPTVRDLDLKIMNSRITQLWSSNRSGFGVCPPSITILLLFQVKGLKHVWRPDSQMDHLESLSLTNCQDLISLAPSPSASFRSLSTLRLIFCFKLTELIKPSVAKTMTNLVTLQINSCRALKEIVTADDDDNDQTKRECIVFNRLKTLELENLDILEGFCVSSCYSFNFPCLEEVSKRWCYSMRIFCNGDVITPKLHNVRSQGSARWEGDLNTTIKQDYQVELQSIEILRLSRFPELVERWGRELPFRRFSQLYELVVDKYPLIPVALPSSIMLAVSRCVTLVVEKCDSVEEILDCGGVDQNESHDGLMPRVSRLKLMELPKLRHIWNVEHLPKISCFKNISMLNVHKCNNLTHIFTLPVALGLVRLFKLEDKECALVEVIIKQREDEKPPADWVRSSIFPQLKSVELENLPSLMGFYSGGDVMRCPALDGVSVVDCPRMCLLRSTASSSIEHDEPTLRVFNEQVEILRLEKLVVQWNSSMDKAWHEIVPRSFLRSLEFVQLIGFPTVHQLLPSDFAQVMPNLWKFTAGDSFHKRRLKVYGREIPAGSFAQLEYLEFFDVPDLKHLVEEDSQLGLMFQHLKQLRVSKCNGLTGLVTSSAAKRLVNLERLVVKECERMTEIVSSDGDETGYEIAFKKLKFLELDGLPCLTSFSSGDYTFSFPLLGEVISRSCPNMRTFSKNVPSTPMLEEVQIGEDDDIDAWRWEGGLNSTIETLFTEKNPSSNC